MLILRRFLFIILANVVAAQMLAHEVLSTEKADSVMSSELEKPISADTLLTVAGDSVSFVGDTSVKMKKDWSTWRPDPKKALWLALVIPGGGQIYNRKYWKLPIFYGGFVGCIYALRWNNMMYEQYSQAYLDMMDSDPTTESYKDFIHNVEITSDNASTYQNIFKKRKDKYRRWRDLSFFVLLGVYALSVIDAYVDAELSVFDMSDDLSLEIRPTTIRNGVSNSPLDASVGVQFALNF